MKSTCFVFKLKRKKQVLALVLIEDLGFLPLVREIQRLSTRSAMLHSCKDGISNTRGRNPRSSIGTRVRTYYSYYKLFLYFNLCLSVMLDSLSWSFNLYLSVMLDSLSCSFTSISFLTNPTTIACKDSVVSAIKMSKASRRW